MNLASGDPEGASNAAYSPANIGWMLFGGLGWTMLVLGLGAAVFFPLTFRDLALQP